MFKCAILCVSFLVTGSLAGVAPFIIPCGQTDSDCIKKSSEIALEAMKFGVLGLEPFEPLTVSNVVANSGDLKLTFKDMQVHGLGSCKFNKIERDPVKSTAFLDLDCPIRCNGNYVLGGQLFILDVEGEGPFEIQGDHMNVKVDINLKKNNDNYRITGFTYKYEPKSEVHYKFENLYGGDQAKAAIFNQLLAQNWKEIIMHEHIGQPVIKEIVTVLVKIIDGFFKAVPTNELEIV